jgi:vitamin B12 transporter
VTLSGGTGYKAPTFNELYFPGFGNPDLGPETSRSLETSLRFQRGTQRVALAVYENRVDDLIGFDQNFSPVNIDRTRIRGVELEGAAQLAGWDLSGSLEWQDPENLSGRFAGNVLPRRAREVARADIARRVGPVRLGTRLMYAGERFDNLANTRRLGGYATVDLLAEWAFAPGWRVQARGDNVFDREYATAAFYPQPGSEWHVTLRYAPVR